MTTPQFNLNSVPSKKRIDIYTLQSNMDTNFDTVFDTVYPTDRKQVWRHNGHSFEYMLNPLSGYPMVRNRKTGECVCAEESFWLKF